ncbi:MAG: IclR family transcriptional regulator [Jiangellaceae bacterium]
MGTPSTAPSLSSFDRGLRVLVQIAERGEAAADELAASLDIPLSSVYRYLKTLRGYDLVEENDGRYIPGWRLLELSGQHLAHARLAEVASGILHDMVDKTGETAVITVRVGHQAMCLRQVESTHPIRYAFRINQLLPLYAGAGQRVLLAFAPPPVIRRVLDQPMPKLTDNTMTPEAVRAELEQIRRTGLAVSHGELNSGAVALAMPVAAGGEVLCALALAGPESRCTERWRRAARRTLAEATDTLGQALDRRTEAS